MRTGSILGAGVSASSAEAHQRTFHSRKGDNGAEIATPEISGCRGQINISELSLVGQLKHKHRARLIPPAAYSCLPGHPRFSPS